MMHPDTMAAIAARVAAEHGVTVSELRLANNVPGARERRLAWPRQRAMFEMRETGRHSTTAIGRFFGGRDHSTVIYAVRRYQARAQAKRT